MKQHTNPFLRLMTAGEGGDGGDAGAGAGGGAGNSGEGGDAGAGGQGGNSGNYTPPASQEDLDRIVSDRLARERAKYADYDELKTKVTEFEQQGLSEVEKATQRATEAAAEAGATKAELTQLRVALNHGFVVQDEKTGAFTVDEKAVNLLGTGTEEELTARAKDIAELRKANNGQQGGGGGFSHGPRSGSPASSMNDLLFGGRK